MGDPNEEAWQKQEEWARENGVPVLTECHLCGCFVPVATDGTLELCEDCKWVG